MNLVLLDAATLGSDLSTDCFLAFGNLTVYQNSTAEEAKERIRNADVVLLNKVKLTKEVLSCAKNLKLICEAATGFDNIDLSYCKEHGIAVCNVVGYSTNCVAQVTVSMVLSLMTKLNQYQEVVSNGEYSNGVTPNRVSPAYHEIAGKTWGIIGYGNIGKKVGAIATALGCNVIVNKRTPIAEATCVSLEELCKTSDIISIHTPLNDSTKGMISEKNISYMKPNAILINVARGAVADEAALANAMKEGRLGGLGIDVYSTEPFSTNHPFYEIRNYPNVCFTPHMAWGGYETRVRLLNEMCENIQSFLNGERRNRVD